MVVVQDGEFMFPYVKKADTFLRRFRGLMLRKRLEEGEGLLLENCGRIHTNFMRFVIDAVYLSEEYEVLFCETVAPWKLGKKVRGAKHVLELPKGSGAALRMGETIQLIG